MTVSKSGSDRPDTASRREPSGRARAAGLACALLAALLYQIVAPSGSERLFDLYQRLAPDRLAEGRVHVVLVDPESLAAVGPWPWPRYILARLVERIAADGAAAIGFDMQFPEPDRYNPDHFVALYPELDARARDAAAHLPSMDAVFAEVIGRNPVVLARLGLERGSTDYDVAANVDARSLPVEAVFSARLPDGVPDYPRALANIPDLDEVAAGQGLINGSPDRDGVVRKVPLVARVAGVPTPGLALELVRLGRGLDGIDPIVDGGRLKALRLGENILPVASDGRMRLHFGPLPVGSVTSARSVLQQGLPAGRFKDRIVLVGLAAAGTSDVVTTPLEAQTYGVYVQARAVNAIETGRGLTRPPRAIFWEMAAGVVLAVLIVWLVPRLRLPWNVVLPVVALAALLLASWAAFRAGGMLIDPLRPIAIAGAGGLGLLAVMFVDAGRARQRLEAALDAERLSAARAAGELEAARDIQRGMLPQVDQLAHLHPAVDLDALLEPARSVGGDFFDAMRIDGDRVCFLIGDVTGKGVPAALFMALSKALTRSMLRRGPVDLGAAMTALSDEIARDNGQDMFVTMLVGILDTTTGEVAFCNAGHEDPLLVSADGRVEKVALSGGPPLCTVEGFAYAAETMRLAQGEGLVIVTDGVTEAQSPDGGFFGHARLTGALSGWTLEHPAHFVGARLLSAVRAFEAGGEPSDDVTVLALRYRGGPQ